MSGKSHERAQSLDDSSKELDETLRWVRRHLLAGWLGLFVFLSMGIALEVLHGLKVSAYLDLRNSTRRLMWTLGHAHGSLFSLISLAWAWTMSQLPANRIHRVASWGILGGLLFLPLGFVLGGASARDGDPGVGILFVPLGAGFLLIGVLAATFSVWSGSSEMVNETLSSRAGWKKNSR